MERVCEPNAFQMTANRHHVTYVVSLYDPIETVIAGHGAVGNRSHVEQTKRYLEHLISTAMSSSTLPNLDAIPTEYREWRGESVYFGNLKFLNERYGRS